MIVWCNIDGDKQVNCLVCVYSCPKHVKLKCKTYEENYEKIKALLIEQKYLTKYGIPTFEVPLSLRPKKTKKETPPKKVTAHKKEKAPEVIEVVSSEVVKVKRKRRTKAEMEESRK